jgi:hypothetical protein
MARPVGGLEIEFYRMGPSGPRLGDEAGGRVDRAARPDRDEQVASRERVIDAVHVARHLAEPHHVRPHRGFAASGTRRLDGKVLVPGKAQAALGAERLAELAMHMDEGLGARRLVQGVDVLRHRQNVASVLVLEPGKGVVRRIRPSLLQPAAPEIIELVHLDGIAREACGRRHLVEIEACPKTVLAAERAKPALGREPRAGEDDDAVEAHVKVR